MLLAFGHYIHTDIHMHHYNSIILYKSLYELHFIRLKSTWRVNFLNLNTGFIHENNAKTNLNACGIINCFITLNFFSISEFWYSYVNKSAYKSIIFEPYMHSFLSDWYPPLFTFCHRQKKAWCPKQLYEDLRGICLELIRNECVPTSVSTILSWLLLLK